MAFDSPMIDHPTVPIGEIKPRYLKIVPGDPNEMTVTIYKNLGSAPLSQLTATTSTLLLLNMNGSNGSTAFTDSSQYNRTVNRSGDPVISTNQVKFGGASGYFNGSSYLSSSISEGLGASDFTLEFWYYKTANSGWIFNSRTNGTAYDGIDIRHDLQVTMPSNYLIEGTSVALNTWTHVAIMRIGSNIYRLTNGIVDGFIFNLTNFTGSTFYIGGNPAGNIGYLTGYMDDVRITNQALYSVNNSAGPADGTPIASFNFPSRDGQLIVGTAVSDGVKSGQLYVSVAPTDSFWQYDSLIMEMDGVNTSKIFVDRSKNKEPIRSYGDTQIVSGIGIYNNSSVYFDGNGDYMKFSNTPFAFGVSNFTFEFWINVQTQSTTYPTLFASSPSASGGGFIIYLPGPGTSWGGTDRLVFESSNTGALGPNLQSTSTIKGTGWKHIAISRNGSTFRLFVNGVQEAITTNSTANFTGTSGYGAFLSAGPGPTAVLDTNTYCKTYIDLFRVTNGACRYTSNFTPPTFFDCLKWKRASPAFAVYNSATGQPYDSNWLFYSNLAP
jgi:hypothetical protein